MGCLGGSVWHGIKGMRNSPRGARIRGGYNNVSLRAPSLGGSFAVWGGLFSAYDCALIKLRGKEDPINAIAAGALTGGTLMCRAGAKAMGKNALIGGVLLAVIEGLSIAISHWAQPEQPQAASIMPLKPLQPPSSSLPTSSAASPAIGGLNIAAAAAIMPASLSVRPDEEFGVEDFSFDETQMSFEEDEY